MLSGAEPIILYDGICGFCHWSVQFIIKHNKKGTIKFAALQSETGQELLRKFHLPKNHLDSLVMIRNNKAYTKSAAVLQVCLELGGYWKLFYGLIMIPKPIRDGVYSFIAKYRYHMFGKMNYCQLPPPHVKKRFLP